MKLCIHEYKMCGCERLVRMETNEERWRLTKKMIQTISRSIVKMGV